MFLDTDEILMRFFVLEFRRGSVQFFKEHFRWHDSAAYSIRYCANLRAGSSSFSLNFGVNRKHFHFPNRTQTGKNFRRRTDPMSGSCRHYFHTFSWICGFWNSPGYRCGRNKMELFILSRCVLLLSGCNSKW